jgi:hypothetical protein
MKQLFLVVRWSEDQAGLDLIKLESSAQYFLGPPKSKNVLEKIYIEGRGVRIKKIFMLNTYLKT